MDTRNYYKAAQHSGAHLKSSLESSLLCLAFDSHLDHQERQNEDLQLEKLSCTAKLRIGHWIKAGLKIPCSPATYKKRKDKNPL